MARDESLSDERIKHLEFIQSIVTRLSTNSFIIKGWAITVSAAIFAFEAKEQNWRVAAVALLPIIAFWLLDAYFLRQERLFRKLYDQVRRQNAATEPFSMDISPYKQRVRLWKVATSVTILTFYGPIIAIALLLLLASLPPLGIPVIIIVI